MRSLRFRATLGLCAFVSAFASAQTIFAPGGTVGSISGSNVGIGTSTPTEKLEVSEGDIRIVKASADSRLRLVSGGTDFRLAASQSSGTFVIYDGTNAAYRMLIDSSGNVGIGNGDAAPVARLEVAKAGNAIIAVRQTDTAALGKYAQVVLSHGPTYNQTGDKLWQVVANGMSNGEADLALQYWNGNYLENTRFTSNGRVGIGITSPSARLHVNGGDVHVSDLGSGQVAALGLDSDSGAGDLYFSQQSILKFLVRAHADVSGGTLEFADRASGSHLTRLYIAGNGNVGIGTTSPSHKVAVNGAIRAKEVIVDTGWADHVFAPDYQLASLDEVEEHIRRERHLPGIPSGREVAERGISIGEMQARLVEKIEELTLHLIEQQRRDRKQQLQIAALQQEVARLAGLDSP